MLARLFLIFRTKISKNVTARAMFKRQNLNALFETIHQLTEKEDQEDFKHGLKHNLYYLLSSSAELSRSTSLQEETSVIAASEYEYFLLILKFNQNFLFGDTKYQINISRQERL